MDLYDRLEKAWARQGRYRETCRTLTFTKHGLELGNGTVVAKLARDDWERPILAIDGNEERILALMSVAWDQPMPDGIIEHFHRASRAFSKGDLSLAYICLAQTGLQPLEQDEDSLRQLFLAEGFLRAGISGNELRKEWGLGKYNQNHFPAGSDRGGQFAPKDGGDGGGSTETGHASLFYVSDTNPADARKPGDVPAETGQMTVNEAATWKGTSYAPTPNDQPNDPMNVLAGTKAVKGTAADCSGSVHAILETAGVEYPYTTSSDFPRQVANGKLPFRRLGTDDTPQPGDVVVYKGHMSIYAGDGYVWSAHKEGYPFDKFPVTKFGKPTYYRPVKRLSA